MVFQVMDFCQAFNFTGTLYAGCEGHYEITEGQCGGYPTYLNKDRTNRMILRNSNLEKWICTRKHTIENCRMGEYTRSSTSRDQVEGPWENVHAICNQP